MMRRLLPLTVLFAALCVCAASYVSAQTGTDVLYTDSRDLPARIRQLIALFGPDTTRGTCIPAANLPTNLAKEELIAIGKPATLPLCAVLSENDEWRRIMAVEDLIEIRDPRSIETLVHALQNDANDTVQGEAAQALGEIGDSTAVEPLLNALATRSRNRKSVCPACVAGKAVLALGKIGDRRAISFLLPLLGSREQYAFSFFGTSLGSTVAEALGKLGPAAAEPLRQALDSPDRNVRTDAVQALGFMKERRAVPQLLALPTRPLKDLGPEDRTYQDFKVGIEAIKALGEIGDSRATLSLLKQANIKELLDEANNEPNVVVVEALGKSGDARAVDTLLPLVKSKDNYVRRKALEALWRIKTPKVLEPLMNALEHDDDQVRSLAADLLGKMQERSALPALLKALESKDNAESYYAAVAIGRIESDLLLPLLENRDDSIRRDVIRASGEVGCTQAVPRLLTLIDDAAVKSYAIDALGNLGTADLVPTLEALKREKNDSRRPSLLDIRRAIHAIKRRSSEHASPSSAE